LTEGEKVVAAAKDPKIARYFLAAGFFVPCLLYLAIKVGDLPIEGSWILVPWPTFPLMMSAEAGGGSGGEAIGFLIAALANAAVYALVGLVFRFVYRRVQPRRR
jgi:hypothetical protein